ncbi:MAG: hypothetical protein AAF366_02945 [Pseudomonadota bacterium]
MKTLPEISPVWVASVLALALTLLGAWSDRSMIADIDIPRDGAPATRSP